MWRPARLLLVSVMLAACGERGGPRFADEPARRAAEDTLYAAVLDSLFVAPGVRFILLDTASTRDGLVSAGGMDAAEYRRALRGIGGEGAAEDYLRANRTGRLLRPPPGLPLPVRMRTFRLGEQAPDGSSGAISLSRVGFDSTRTRALVYVFMWWTGEHAGGWLVALRRDGGRWRVQRAEAVRVF